MTNRPNWSEKTCLDSYEKRFTVSNNIATMLQRCVVLKIVVANCLVQHHLKDHVTRDQIQRRFPAQNSVAMLK